ncbi:polysaccharide pyruvyl transferase family protein [Kocuria tytonis]|uniref:Polysaccharide pyruvyl transferase family protein n=1 Tax=Kocuria tytonis TaxID=2054280 RepID=A0A495AAI2_9MICC|nr:polysaccharide pyruvyl transferase family protein [Kocuria tytonis]RKQ36414.1 polysaccharide pyruvyl transferase family protein [Kocuria tytonis]
MTRLGHVGFFGWGNYGDELMYQTWISAFGDEFTHERVHDVLVRPYFSRPAEEIAADVDAVVIGGGDLIHPDAISTLYWNRAWLTRPVIVAGVGVALERTRRRGDVPGRLRTFLQHENVHFVGTRDQGSTHWLRDTAGLSREIETGADPGFAAALPPAGHPGRDTVGVVFRKVPTDQDLSTLDRLLRLMEPRGFRVEVLVLAVEHDQALERRALEDVGVPPEIIRTESSIDALTAALGGYRSLLTAKFHGAVMAARYGVPALSLRMTHKVRALSIALGDPWLAREPHLMDDTALATALERRSSSPLLHTLEETATHHMNRAVSATRRVAERKIP